MLKFKVKSKSLHPLPDNVIKLPVKTEETEETESEVSEFLNLTGNLDSLLKASHVIQKGCKDFTVLNGDTSRIRMENKRTLFYLPEGNSSGNVSPISDYAMGQLCNKISVPFSYIKRCESNLMQELVNDNINQWLDITNKDYFIREHNNRIRGILSPRYSIMDTPDILDVILNGVNFDGFDIKGYFLSPERFHLRLVEDKKLLRVDDLFAGFQIDSSDIGRSTLKTQFLIYKLSCTNGMAVTVNNLSSFYEQKHLGISADEFRAGLITALKQFYELKTKILPIIKDAKQADIFKHDNIPPEQVISRMTNLGEEQSKEVSMVMQVKGYPSTRWGLINSLTDYAQRYTLERRLTIEKIASELLVA